MQGLCGCGRGGEEEGVWEALSTHPMQPCWDGSPVSRRLEALHGCSEAGFLSCWGWWVSWSIQRLPRQDVDSEAASSVGQAGQWSRNAAAVADFTPVFWRRGDLDISRENVGVYWQASESTLPCRGWLPSVSFAWGSQSVTGWVDPLSREGLYPESSPHDDQWKWKVVQCQQHVLLHISQ